MTGPVAHREKVHDDIDGLAFVALEAVHQPGERGQRVGVQGHVPQWEPVIASQDQLSSRPAPRVLVCLFLLRQDLIVLHGLVILLGRLADRRQGGSRLERRSGGSRATRWCRYRA